MVGLLETAGASDGFKSWSHGELSVSTVLDSDNIGNVRGSLNIQKNKLGLITV